MYKARNGFILHNADTGNGWIIKEAGDIMTALLNYPAFNTVDRSIIWQAIDKATQTRKEYTNINDLADYILQNYL